MVQDTSRQINVKVCRRADLSADRPAERKTGCTHRQEKDHFRDAKGHIWVYSYGWEYLAALTAGNHKEISRQSGFFLNPKGFENMGAKLCYACVANARRTAYLWHFKGPILFFFLSIFYF